MATFREALTGVWDLSTDILASAKPIAVGVKYTAASTAEAAIQLFNAVKCTPEEHAEAEEAIKRYFPEK